MRILDIIIPKVQNKQSTYTSDVSIKELLSHFIKIYNRESI